MCASLEESSGDASEAGRLLEELTLEFERVRAALAVERGRAEWNR
jgi:hypothetical protein